MKTFFRKTIKPFLMLAGIFTATPISLAFAPQAGLEMIFGLQFIQEYTLFIQHWGILVPTIGVFIIISAFKTEWQVPVLLIAAIGKLSFFIFYLLHMQQPYAQGFSSAAFIDFIIAIYFFGYIAYLKMENAS